MLENRSFMTVRALSSVGRASRLHRENSHENVTFLSISGRTERDSMANKPELADQLRTTRIVKTVYDEATEDYVGDALYFISEGPDGNIKIGRGKNPRGRAKGMQVGNSQDLILKGQIDNGGWMEAFWHCCFDRSRIRGEWFRPDEPLLSAIETALAGGDWTDHVPMINKKAGDLGEWQEHLLDALDAYEEAVIYLEREPSAAAYCAIHDPDFDGRSIFTRFYEATHPTPSEGAAK